MRDISDICSHAKHSDEPMATCNGQLESKRYNPGDKKKVNK